MLRLLYRQRRLVLVVVSLVLIYRWYAGRETSRRVAVGHEASEAAAAGSTKLANNHRFSSRIVAVGDLHGDLNHAVRVLRMAGLVDLRDQWIGGPTVLVQTGDIVDRGKDTILLYKWMDALRTQAQLSGGAVVSLLGNHEVS